MFDLSALDAPRLTGRGDLQQSLRPHIEGGVLITNHRGCAGIGATSLARRLAADALADYPGGCVEVDLRGSAPGGLTQPTPASVQRRVVMILDQDADLPEDTRSLRKAYLDTLSQHRIVLILNDASSPSQLRALLPRKGSTAIVTSSADLVSGFPRLHAVYLEDLSQGDVYHLMVQSAPEVANLPKSAVRRITERLEGNPLALRITAPLLGQQHNLTPRELLRALESARRRIVALQGASTPNTPIDVAVETCYDVMTLDLRQQFEALAVFPAPFAEDAAAAVWRITTDEARETLRTLSRASLVEHHTEAGLCEIHQRVRTLTQELLLGQLQRSRELVSRYVGHYLRSAIQISAALSSPSPRRRSRSVAPYPFWDHIPIAWQRLNGEDPGWPKPPGMDRWIREFPLYSRALLDILLSRSDYRDWLSRSLSTAESTDDPRLLCALLGALGQTQAAMEQHNDALVSFERQRGTARECEAQDYEAEALMFSGTSYGALGKLPNAEVSWRHALQLFDLLGDPRAREIRQWLEQVQETI